MKIIIAGSRNIKDADDHVATAMLKMAMAQAADFEVAEIVCGEGGNVDEAGRRWAESRKVPVKSFPADWSKGIGAGPRRNREMANYATALVAIWDGRSRGTANMIAHASVQGLEIYTVLG